MEWDLGTDKKWRTRLANGWTPHISKRLRKRKCRNYFEVQEKFEKIILIQQGQYLKTKIVKIVINYYHKNISVDRMGIRMIIIFMDLHASTQICNIAKKTTTKMKELNMILLEKK